MDLQRRLDAALGQPDLQTGQHVEQAVIHRKHPIGLDVAQRPAQLQVLVAIVSALGAPVRRPRLLAAAHEPDRAPLGQQAGQPVAAGR
jgi:hypothetical protein